VHKTPLIWETLRAESPRAQRSELGQAANHLDLDNLTGGWRRWMFSKSNVCVLDDSLSFIFRFQDNLKRKTQNARPSKEIAL
jgi:hypothetical protein